MEFSLLLIWEAEVVSVYESMKLALEVMENIEETIDELHSQAEKVSTMLKDLMLIVKQNMECFQGLEKEITSIMSLEAHEKNLVEHFIQANKEPEEDQGNCKHHLMRSFKNKEIALTYSMLNFSYIYIYLSSKMVWQNFCIIALIKWPNFEE
ncbi:unnamed protein product [Amaranthus hypochondriacus]